MKYASHFIGQAFHRAGGAGKAGENTKKIIYLDILN
jgi:hypothetical protein